MKPIEYTPDRITNLKPNEVFVFGSNFAGKHGLGAAKLAAAKFGAIQGQGTGLMGQCYGIATKDERFRTLPLYKIQPQIAKLMAFACRFPEKRFLVTQIGCGLAGYKPEQIAPMFFIAGDPPVNVILPRSFWAVHEQISAMAPKNI